MAAQVPPAVALVQNRVAAAQRASAIAGYLLILNLIGLGFGPVFVGVLSDQALAMGIRDSLKVGLLSISALLIVPILLLFWTARVIGVTSENNSKVT